MFFPIETLMQVCRAEDEDAELLELYLDSAIDFAQSYCNRKFFEDADDMLIQQSTVSSDIRAAIAEYDDTVKTLNGDNTVSDAQFSELVRLAKRTRDKKLDEAHRTSAGMVFTPAIKQAVLLLVGHLYYNRESVVVTQGIVAAQVPLTSTDILDRYIYLGANRL